MNLDTELSLELQDALSDGPVAADIKGHLGDVVTMLKAAGLRSGAVYLNGMDLVLQHGREMKLAEEQPEDLDTPRACFRNSYTAAAVDGMRYCEGWAFAKGVPLAVHHAWNLNAAGEVVDVTWGANGKAYFGVEFPIKQVADAMVNGSGSVLDDWMRRHPALQVPYTGTWKRPAKGAKKSTSRR